VEGKTQRSLGHECQPNKRKKELSVERSKNHIRKSEGKTSSWTAGSSIDTFKKAFASPRFVGESLQNGMAKGGKEGKKPTMEGRFWRVRVKCLGIAQAIYGGKSCQR